MLMGTFMSQRNKDNRSFGCEGKNRYGKNQAESVRMAVMKKRNRKIRVYECRCGWWHLTSDIGHK